MAMKDKEVWERADDSWRKGIEGIYSQLERLLANYQVKVIDPIGEAFDPHRDEAVGTEQVEDEKMIDRVISVVQRGYEMKIGDSADIIRHARVTTGIMKD
jgi:molecular chaperone GrpE